MNPDIAKDPERIDAMIELLRIAWHRYPYYRLGQLIVNATGVDDPFYVQDGRTALGLMNVAFEGGESGR